MPDRSLAEQALEFHAAGRPGKLEIAPTKALTTQHDLSLAYSPGVAEPCLEINRDVSLAYDYTAKGNLVAVISNGTAVLGLGDIGAAASKPVMEGKAVLFKRFADIDGLDLEVDTSDVDAFVDCVRHLGPSFGGINLEDIKAPDCFIIESRLREAMDIPVFHDDQHGTAIIAAAGLINALHLTDRDIAETTIVINGAGAAGIASAELFKAMGVRSENVTLCDRSGVIYQGREKGLNQWKAAHAVDTDARTLAEAIEGADVFIGLSVKGALTKEMVASMADQPIIFALANPDPEILPEEAREVRQDAIIATGRSDYPNQVNNVLGFPYIFRGALDVRASTINDEMKIAAAEAIAALARQDVPDEVGAAYSGRDLHYGPEYLIPAPFDPRLITDVSIAVAKAAIKSGVALRPIEKFGAYRATLQSRLDPTASSIETVYEIVRSNPKRVVFAEGEEERAIRAAVAFRNQGLGEPILVGRIERIREAAAQSNISGVEDIRIENAAVSDARDRYTDWLYERLQRRGHLQRDVQRLVNQNRNVFASCMVHLGDADALVTGLTRPFAMTYGEVSSVLDALPNHRVFGLSVLMVRGRTVFIADSTVDERPPTEALVDIAIQSAAKARRMGHEPKVAFVSFSNFGQPERTLNVSVRGAVTLMDERTAQGQAIDFEYDGEMAADVALDYGLMKRLYPFCRLSGAANVLIMPGLHSANVSAKMLQKLGGAVSIGPLLIGMEKPVQIVQMGATVNDLVTAAAFASQDALQ